MDSIGFVEVPEFLEGYLMPGKELEQAVFQIADRFIEIHQTDGGYDYSIYDMEYKLLDGGMYESDIGIIPAARSIATDLKEPAFNTVTEQYERTGVQGNVYAGDRLYRMPEKEYPLFLEKVEKANQVVTMPHTEEVKGSVGQEAHLPFRKVEEQKEQNTNMPDNVLNNGSDDKERRELHRQAAQEYQEKSGASLSFYAVGCEEFPDLGPHYENLTLKEAVGKYREMLKDPALAYMGNGLGVVLSDPLLTDVIDTSVLLIKGKTIQTANLDDSKDFAEHPLLLECIEELHEEFPDFKYRPLQVFLEEIFPKKMTAQQIAIELIRIAEEFDFYDFRDRVSDPDNLQMEIEYNTCRNCDLFISEL